MTRHVSCYIPNLCNCLLVLHICSYHQSNEKHFKMKCTTKHDVYSVCSPFVSISSIVRVLHNNSIATYRNISSILHRGQFREGGNKSIHFPPRIYYADGYIHSGGECNFLAPFNLFFSIRTLIDMRVVFWEQLSSVKMKTIFN